MGCFMGCFGLSSNKKRRNSTRKILPRDQRICSYEPLYSSDPTGFGNIVEKPEKISNSNLSVRCEVEEEEKNGAKKTRKRVRFNLNVQTYEPIVPTTVENEDEEGKEERSKGVSVFDKKKPEDLSNRSAYPSNYRYQNCVESFEDEEEEEMGYGESDLEDEEDYYTDDDENEYEDDADDEDEGSQDVTPLLNPVVNLAQWKAVKAKPVRVKPVMKENVEADTKPLLKEIIVNTSLSNWLASPKSFQKRSPIVDITNMDNR